MLKYSLVFFLFTIVFISCSKKNEKHLYTNDLISETSPYLLQHAHNPVNWRAWNTKSLAKAKKENKLIVISIGYAACHWCHVMEKESFKDSTVANIMNKNFVNIKVDREERPDVDKVYIKAVQLMTGNSGWPLNVIALPDGRPLFGGTYFTKKQWLQVLEQTSEKFKNNPEDFYAFADQLEESIKSVGLIQLNADKPVFTNDFIKDEVANWKQSFDTIYGGNNTAPKFMMPNNYQFLMRYAYQNNDNEVLKHVENTLEKIASRGIFDHINGGFFRYSTDKKWHIPHFEKMLYDNAQLVSLYANAFQLTKKEIYKEVVIKTLHFIKEELTSPEGVFYSSLDADNYNHENVLEEGGYYTWSKKELEKILKNEFILFSKYYHVNDSTPLENGKIILIKSKSDVTFSEENNLSIPKLKELKIRWKTILKKELKKRNKPRLDDKTLTSWNALMAKGFLDAYTVFNEKEYLNIALKNAHFILKNQLSNDGTLYHNYKNGKSTINGYLEDYATTSEMFIKLYEVTSEEIWLESAKKLTDFTIENFYNRASKMFYFTSKKEPSLVVKTIDYEDNVIASSNSVMAKNLFLLSHYLSSKKYNEIATVLLNNVKPKVKNNGRFFSNWLDLMLNYSNPYYEVVIVGKDAKQKLDKLNKQYLPNILISYSNKNTNLPLLENRYIDDKTYIYVCKNNTCKLPVETIAETLKLLRK